MNSVGSLFGANVNLRDVPFVTTFQSANIGKKRVPEARKWIFWSQHFNYINNWHKNPLEKGNLREITFNVSTCHYIIMGVNLFRQINSECVGLRWPKLHEDEYFLGVKLYFIFFTF